MIAAATIEGTKPLALSLRLAAWGSPRRHHFLRCQSITHSLSWIYCWGRHNISREALWNVGFSIHSLAGLNSYSEGVCGSLPAEIILNWSSREFSSALFNKGKRAATHVICLTNGHPFKSSLHHSSSGQLRIPMFWGLCQAPEVTLKQRRNPVPPHLTGAHVRGTALGKEYGLNSAAF